MNYLELELGGEKRGAKLGIGFLRFVTEQKKITLDDFLKSFQVISEKESVESIYSIIEIMYYSLVYNCKRKKEEANFDMDDVMEWIDDDGGFTSNIFISFMEALTQSFGTDLGKTTPQKKVATKK